jgi:hypothetical protein
MEKREASGEKAALSGFGPRLLPAAGIALLILLLLVPGASARAPNTCIECHDDYYQYIDILQDDPGSSLPDRIGEGGTAEVRLVVRNYCSSKEFSELSRVTATLASLNGYISIEGDASLTQRDMKVGTTEFGWTVRSLAMETDVLLITVDALNSHYDTPLRDEYSVLVNAPVSLSSGTVEMTSGEAKVLTISGRENVTDLTLTPQDPIAGRVNITPSSPDRLDAGESVDVNVESSGSRGTSGDILLSWTDDDGKEESFHIRTELFGAGSDGSDDGTGSSQRLVGRLLGWTATALLIASIILGGYPRKGKRPLNRLLGNARRRVQIHCLISYEILLVTLLHSIILMLGHWNFMMTNDNFLWVETSTSTGIYIDLGTISLVLMAIIGFQGAFQKRLCRLMGPKVWRYSHLFLSLGALILVLIHAVTVGSTLQPYIGDFIP